MTVGSGSHGAGRRFSWQAAKVDAPYLHSSKNKSVPETGNRRRYCYSALDVMFF
jgi:hypothetical protein